ncbi:MAG: RloB family protein [Methanomassiliicoccales archaeon]|nr:RloB family protein [Methanomassiliicoccales archaeon]
MRPYGRRRSGTRETYRHLVIFCEGERTEVTYFKNYRRMRSSGVLIEVRSDRKNDPLGLVKCALKRINDPKDPLNIDGGDSIWCVFDADDHEQRKLEEAIKLSGGNVRLALSVPCFELWFILHYRIPTARMTSNDALCALKDILPDYTKDLDVFERLEESREKAIMNSMKLEGTHDNEFPNVENNPSTMVYHLVLEILNVQNLNRKRSEPRPSSCGEQR